MTGPEEQPPGAAGEPDAPSGSGEDVGDVAEEAAKLMGALADWARDQGPGLGAGLGAGLGSGLGAGLSGLAEQVAEQAARVGEHVHRGLQDNLATGAPECAWCPVCRAVTAVRQLSPEVRAHLTSAAASLVQAAAGVLATQVPDDAGPRTTGADRSEADPTGAAAERRPSRVQHIDLDDDPPGPPGPPDPARPPRAEQPDQTPHHQTQHQTQHLQEDQ